MMRRNRTWMMAAGIMLAGACGLGCEATAHDGATPLGGRPVATLDHPGELPSMEGVLGAADEVGRAIWLHAPGAARRDQTPERSTTPGSIVRAP